MDTDTTKAIFDRVLYLTNKFYETQNYSTENICMDFLRNEISFTTLYRELWKSGDLLDCSVLRSYLPPYLREGIEYNAAEETEVPDSSLFLIKYLPPYSRIINKLY